MLTAQRRKFSARTKNAAFKKILVATDFSESSRNAVREAALLLKENGSAQLRIMHVADQQLWQFAPPSTMEAIREQVWDAAAKSIGEWQRSAIMPKNAKTLLCEGDIPTEIQKVVQKWKPDLLIIGTHGRQGFQQLMIGSIAQEILRTVDCPVMTIGPATVPSTGKSIVLAMDFSAASMRSASFALMLARRTGLKLVVVRAIESAMKQKEEIALRRIRDRFEKRFNVRGVTIVYRMALGDVSEAIVRAGMEADAKYIVMGAKRGGAFLRASTHWPKAMTYRVICGSPAPVITVRQ